MLEKVSLFHSKRDFFYFFLACGFTLFYTLHIEYLNYKQLTKFDTALVHATILSQYTKTKASRTYQILKLKSDDGFLFFTLMNKSFADVKGKKLELEINTDTLTFYQYMTSFFTYNTLQDIEYDASLKEKINNFIAEQHTSQNMKQLYQALFLATSIDKELQANFSVLGVSHIIAISGFHLGILSAVLYFLLTKPYTFLQNRYFPYRHAKSDLFIIIATVLLSYMLFLDSPDSLLRSFTMLIIGFILYDRHLKIISMQTLFLSVTLLLMLFPRLLFSLGFWLSVGGVFYIFLFLIYFKHLKVFWQFFLIEFWTYLMMLPLALAIFGNFGFYHPLSILLTMLFIPFYPLSIILHLLGFGAIFDGVLEDLIALGEIKAVVTFEYPWLLLHLLLSVWAIFQKVGMWILLLFSSGVFFYALYAIA